MKDNISLFFSEKKDGNMAFYAGKEKERAGVNRRRFFMSRRIDPSMTVFLQQTHSDHIVVVKESDNGRGAKDHESAFPDADATITDIKGVALCVQVADCVPILFWDKERGVIGAVHSGWRGTLQNIAGKTVKKMCETFGVMPENLHAWIGPSIGGCCLSVDGRIVFPVENGGFKGLSPDKTHWDIAKACCGQLIQSGILSENIEFSGECTACNAQKFFSYKWEGNRAGRMLAGIVLSTKR